MMAKSKKLIDQKTSNTRNGDGNRLLDLIKQRDESITKLSSKMVQIHEINKKFSEENANLNHEVQNLRQIIQTGCKRCLNMEKSIKHLHDEKTNLFEQNCALQNDIEMMKVLVYRLNVQLETYQERLRRYSDVIEGVVPAKKKREPPQWDSIQSHTLAPLLNAYHSMIEEKSELIEQYQANMEGFTERVDYVLQENKNLHAMVAKLKEFQETMINDNNYYENETFLLRNKLEVQTQCANIAKSKLVDVLRFYEQRSHSKVVPSTENEKESAIKLECDCDRQIKEAQEKHEIEVTSLKKMVSDKTDAVLLSMTSKKEQEEEVEKLKAINNTLMEKNRELRMRLRDAKKSKEEMKILLNSKTIEDALLSIRANFDRIENEKRNNSAVQREHAETAPKLQLALQNFESEKLRMTRRLQQNERLLKQFLQSKTRTHEI